MTIKITTSRTQLKLFSIAHQSTLQDGDSKGLQIQNKYN